MSTIDEINALIVDGKRGRNTAAKLREALALAVGWETGDASSMTVAGRTMAARVADVTSPLDSHGGAGAVGDGVADDTAAVQRAIDATPVSGVLDFGGANRVYRTTASLNWLPNRTYRGVGATISCEGAGEDISVIPAGSVYDVTIDGLSFDGNDISGTGIRIGDGDGVYVSDHRNIRVRNCTFSGIPYSASFGQGWAIWGWNGLKDSSFRNNKFVSVGGAIMLLNASYTDISDNEVNGLLGDNFLYMLYMVADYQYGVTVQDNRGRGLTRMAIEVQADSGCNGQFGAIYKGNQFSFEEDHSFGISVMDGGEAAEIELNVLKGAGVAGTIGIEAQGNRLRVENNDVSGFAYGAALSTGSYMKAERNGITGPGLQYGVYLSSAATQQDHVSVYNNNIVDAELSGVLCGYTGVQHLHVGKNTIERSRATASGDGSFIAINLGDASSPWSYDIEYNTIVQTSTGTAVIASADFIAVGCYASGSDGYYAGMRLTGNKFINLAAGSYGRFVFSNSGQGLLSGVQAAENHLRNVEEVGYDNPSVSASRNTWSVAKPASDGAAFWGNYRQETGDFEGTGSPQGVVTANIGSTYHRRDGSLGSITYTKTEDSSPWGWVADAYATVAQGAKADTALQPDTAVSVAALTYSGIATATGAAQVDSGTAVTLSATAPVQRVRLTGNATITLPALTPASEGRAAVEVELVQDGTGNRAVTWAAQAGDSIAWDNSSVAPAIATTAAYETHFLFRRRQGSTVWRAAKIYQEA